MKAEKPVAFDSPDHIQPWGTVNDNSTNPRFNQKLFWWLPKRHVSLLDIGCSGGGFVKSMLEVGCMAAGVEGSDYSKKMQRAEWATIPGNLFTADATAPFELTLQDDATNKVQPLKFSVVTAWEFIEHIAEPDLAKVMRNIDTHLAPNGIVIMSVSPNEEYINGVRLHQTVAEKPWWVEKFASLGFTNHDNAVTYFDRDWIRGEDNNAPGSFHVVLTRTGEELPFADRINGLACLYPQVASGSPYLTLSFAKQGMFAQDPMVVVEVGYRPEIEDRWESYGKDVERTVLGVSEHEIAHLSSDQTKNGRFERFLPLILSDRAESASVYAARESRYGVAGAPVDRAFASRFKEGLPYLDAEQRAVQAVTLDSLVSTGAISKPTFIKIDMEGAELKILKGASQALADGVLGVSVEVCLQPLRKGAPSFEDVRAYLADRGFSMFDMKVDNWTRGIVADHDGPKTWPGRGQAVRCRATFLRDMMPELEVSRSLTAHHRLKIAKLASLAEVLGFSDYSVELLVASEKLPS
jgi:FkbM family methyltransferase